MNRSALPIVLHRLDDLPGEVGHANVCLTFDDGPDPVYTPLILDILAEHKVRANFFVLGETAARYPYLIGRMIAEGHVVGNHTYSHCHPWMITAQRARLEVSDATKVIRQITGQAPRWFRPPHGRLRTAMLKQVHAENMATVLWSRSAIDWGLMATAAGISQRLHDIRANDIVLMHDGQRQHNHPEILLQQLPAFIQWLRQEKLQPVTLDEVS